MQVSSFGIAFIAGERGDQPFAPGWSLARVRLTKKDAAKELLEKIQKKLEDWHMDKWNVEGDDVEISVLEGDEEKTFLDECKNDIKNSLG